MLPEHKIFGLMWGSKLYPIFQKLIDLANWEWSQMKAQTVFHMNKCLFLITRKYSTGYSGNISVNTIKNPIRGYFFIFGEGLRMEEMTHNFNGSLSKYK